MSEESEYEKVHKRLTEKQKEFLRKKTLEFQEEMRKEGIGVTINDGDGFAETEKLKAEIEKGSEVESWARKEVLKQDLLEIKKELEEERREVDPVSRGTYEGVGGGQIPLSKATAKNVGSYDSYESMIDDLRAKERSDNPEEKANAELILNEFFHKTLTGQRAPLKEMQFKGDVDIKGKEKGLFATLREEFRRRKLAEKKERDADE